MDAPCYRSVRFVWTPVSRNVGLHWSQTSRRILLSLYLPCDVHDFGRALEEHLPQQAFEDKFAAVIDALQPADGQGSSTLWKDVSDSASSLITSEWSDEQAFTDFIRSDAFREVTLDRYGPVTYYSR